MPNLRALLGFVTLFLCLAASDAFAGPCEKKHEPGPALKECRQKQLEKWRGKKPAVKPGALSPGLASLNVKNPLNTYRWYVGKSKPTGDKDVDGVARSVARLDAAVTLSDYVSHLAKKGKTDKALAVAKPLLSVLEEQGKSLPETSAAVQRLSKNLAKDPASALTTGRVIADSSKRLAQLTGKLPKATQSVAALVGRAPAALKDGRIPDSAIDEVSKAVAD